MTRTGLKEATTDQELISSWWETYPEANIGIRTGAQSGVWVLDLDGEDGIKALEELEAKHGALPKTVTALTGGRGMHLYFRFPVDREIKNGAKLHGVPIDVRGTDGYVLAPTSNHISGRDYRWKHSPEDTPIAEAPAWLLDFVSSRGQHSERRQGEDLFDQLVDNSLDLRTAPGVGEGKRHTRLCQLVGLHLARGENPVQVYDDALKWAASCTPPMDREEVFQVVRDLTQKEGDRFDESPITEEAAWPTLSEDALYGLPGEIVRAIEPHTEADPAAILVQLLTFFGNVIGRKPFFLVESTPHYGNLFAVLVGETAKGRKGTSENRVRELFSLVDPDWLKKQPPGGLSSGEGLIWAVRDPIEKREPVKKDGKVVDYQMVIVDHGVEDKRLLVIESEFAAVLRIARRDGNILSALIRQAWDSGNLGQMTKNSAARATGAHTSIIGHITKEELQDSMNAVEGFNGFANRFLWICVKRSKLLPHGGGKVNLSPFVARLQSAVDHAIQTEQMQRDAAATQLWEELYRKMAKSHGGLFGGVTSRAEAQVLRLSMIYALFDSSAVIRSEHLRAAMALWQYAEDSARYIFGSSTGDPLADKILAIIREQSVTKKEIHDKTHRHHKGTELDRVLAILKRLKLIRSEKISDTGGRPAERWIAVET
jgi:hypothetical protein